MINEEKKKKKGKRKRKAVVSCMYGSCIMELVIFKSDTWMPRHEQLILFFNKYSI